MKRIDLHGQQRLASSGFALMNVYVPGQRCNPNIARVSRLSERPDLCVLHGQVNVHMQSRFTSVHIHELNTDIKCSLCGLYHSFIVPSKINIC